jgi:hypothetical protein
MQFLESCFKNEEGHEKKGNKDNRKRLYLDGNHGFRGRNSHLEAGSSQSFFTKVRKLLQKSLCTVLAI